MRHVRTKLRQLFFERSASLDPEPPEPTSTQLFPAVCECSGSVRVLDPLLRLLQYILAPAVIRCGSLLWERLAGSKLT